MNQFRRTARVLLGIAAVVCVLFVWQYDVEAQCSMCRAALAGSSNANFIRNFNIAVLVLLVPPVTIFCTFFVVLSRYRRRDEVAQSDSE